LYCFAEEQWDALTSKYAQLLVCTPGRLCDFLRGKQVNLKKVTYVVLDEADRMLTMGFSKELTTIFAATSPQRQTLCFSATFPTSVENALRQWVSGKRPSVRIVIGLRNQSQTATTDTNVPASLAVTGPIGGIDQILSTEIGATDSSTPALSSSASGDAVSVNGSGSGNRNGLLLVSPHISQIVHCCAPHKKPRKLLRFLTDLKQKEDAQRVRHKTSVLIFVNKIKT
jgi:superfamily II DNA/RNA helicase